MGDPNVIIGESITLVALYLAMLGCFIYAFSLTDVPKGVSTASFERRRKRLNFYFHVYWIFGVCLMAYLYGIFIEMMGD